MKIENIIRRVLREQQEEKLSELPPFDDFFDSDWNLVLNFMNRYPSKKFYYPSDLDLGESDIESLGNLVRVEGDLNLYNCLKLQSLGNLEYVGGDLDLSISNIESLGNLKYVDGNLDLYRTDIKSLGNLKYVYGNLDLSISDIESLGSLVRVSGDLDLLTTPLSEKYTEEKIRDMVEVVGFIDMW